MIRYEMSVEKISPGMLSGFFVNWPNPPSNETFLMILTGSYKAILAIDDERKKVGVTETHARRSTCGNACGNGSKAFQLHFGCSLLTGKTPF